MGSFSKWPVSAAFAALALTYAMSAATTAGGGDAGEFAALAARGGIAHPPGYPLYVILLRSFAWLPTEPVHRAALATSLLGVLAAWLLFRVAMSFGSSRASAALVTAIFACAPLTWKLATTPEVFAGNVCIALAIVWLSGPRPPLRGEARAVALALLAGLGFAHHHSIVLVAPIGVLGAVAAITETRRRGRAVALMPMGLAVGLLPYGYTWLAGRGALGTDVVSWGDTSTLGGVLHHALRRDYGTTSLRAAQPGGGGSYDVLGQLLFLGKTLTRYFLALPVIVVASLIAARARVLGPPRGPRWALLASVMLAGPVFVCLFNIPPQAVGASIVERFHLLPAALALVFVAPAFDPLFAARSAKLATAIVAGVAVVQSAVAIPMVVEQHRPTVQRYAENVLAVVEPRAIVVGSGDHRAGSFMYAEARGIRPDAVFVQPPLMFSVAYRRRMSERVGVELVAPRDEVLDAHALLAQLVATGRPVYVTNWPAPGLERSFASYPVGPVLRLLADPRQTLPPPSVLALNERTSVAMKLEAEPPARGTWAGTLYGDYARPWIALAGAFRAAGDEATAKECELRAARLMPLPR